MAEVLEYDRVYKEDRGTLSQGRFKATSGSIAFKNSKTGKIDQISANDIERCWWTRLASYPGLRVATKKGDLFRFGGFEEGDYEKFANFFKENYSAKLKEKEFCLKGWNWGVANFHGGVMTFNIDDKPAFEVPLRDVSHCTSTKNEVTVEFHQNDDSDVALMEMRFHIPNPPDAEADPVQTFVDNVMSKADIIQATGDAIVTFQELQCLTPRGRYDIKLFPTFIQLHGKTFDYKIPLTTVLRMFRLPHKDGRQVFFVLSLDPPIKQGNTRYPFLILNFNIDDEVRVELNIAPQEEELRQRFEVFNEVEEGLTIEIITKLMKTLVQRKITYPYENFGGKNHIPVITSSYKNNLGQLYPLDRGFIWVHKPAVHIRFEEIATINFARGGGSTRSFDFEIETKHGVVHVFSSIEKEEYARLYDFVENKKLRVKNIGGTAATASAADDQDDFGDSDLDDEQDAYFHRVKQEGRERDSDEESDESFNPDGEESDPEEEFDSEASGSSSSDEDSDDSSRKRKKEKKKAKKEKKEKSKSKSSKKEKNGKPKKPMSAYMLWMNEVREQIKKDNPGISITDIAKKAGEMWKELKDKSKWEKEAARLREQWKKDGGGSGATPSKSSSSSSPKKKDGDFKSKEFIDEDDDSSSSSGSDENTKKGKGKKKGSDDDSDAGSDSDSKSKKKRKSKDSKKDKKRKKKESSDEEEESDADSD